MTANANDLAQRYLQHLTAGDLELLSREVADVHSHPEGLLAALSSKRLAEAVFTPAERAVHGPLGGTCSPFLVFAVAIEQAAAELAGATFVVERLGSRMRAPVFDVDALRTFLADRWRRLFLAELLASYTHVASGSVLISTRRGWRRRRFSELDPVHMAALAEVVSPAERPGVFRRLGDLALFLTGIFPDAVARRGLGPLEEGRLLRAGRGLPPPKGGHVVAPGGLGDDTTIALLERLGRRWYGAAAQAMPKPVPADLQVIGELADRFSEARRVLNVVTDRFLFASRASFFGFEA